MITGSPIPPIAQAEAPREAGHVRAPSEAPPVDEARAELLSGGRWQRFPSTGWMWLCLLGIMGIGAFLRFWRLGYQCYWTDESATISKICGTFDYLLQRLSDQGFPPGWYALLRAWCLWIEHITGSGATAFSPTSTRSLAAIFGLLTIPGMYFLARQFTDRKGSLLVALLTAVNPFLIYYARDIKMYAPLWCMVVWNMAIFFRWQTTQRHWRWFPLFVITGVVMTSMQSLAWVVVALQLIFLITRPRLKGLDGPLWVVAVGAMGALPAWWFLNRTAWVDRVVDSGNRSGLDWITRYTDMSWKTIASLPSVHLLGYLWPTYPPDYRIKDWFELGGKDFDAHLATRSWPWLVQWEFAAMAVVASILVLGLIPWRGIRRSAERAESVTQHRWWWVALWIVLPMGAFALTWIPDDSPWHHWVWGKLDPRPLWEPRYLGVVAPALLLWLAASLRRLPTWPVRGVAIGFVVAACTFSSLSNHLIYRNAPFNRAAEVAMRYYDPKQRRAIAVAEPAVAYPMMVELLTYELAAGRRPTMDEEPVIPYENFRQGLYAPVESAAFVAEMRNVPYVRTIVLTDRYGDVTEPANILSDESLAKRLGPGWTLVHEETYEWHYEWRYYIFHTWRTRVWVRENPATATRPQNP
ncbi:MAG TPA: glycosyltransferase family 39 protein [Phycisphaerae bacterium]|nr:glycosyltransferase family 39 protein [Phycisphaerae bacterium]